MKTRKRTVNLEKGQIWKLKDSHVEILAMGKRLAHYKHFRTFDQKRVPVQLGSIPSVQDFLKANKAVLIERSHAE